MASMRSATMSAANASATQARAAGALLPRAARAVERQEAVGERIGVALGDEL